MEVSYLSTAVGVITITTDHHAVVSVDITPSVRTQSQGSSVCSAYHRKVSRMIERYFEGKSYDFKAFIPAPRSLFRKRVLEAVCRVNHGQTASYGDIAMAIGSPTAVRAVAHAIAENKALIIIPCHRVTRADGTIGKYRGGVMLKKQLLDFEEETLRGRSAGH